MASLISSNQNTNVPIELSGNMTKETENLRRKIDVFDRNSISDNNVDKYADYLTEVLSNDAKLFIPNKKVTVNPHEPHWITCNIKQKKNKKRQRKRLYRKAKQDSQARNNIGQDFGHLEME